jgi:hypothetical protein
VLASGAPSLLFADEQPAGQTIGAIAQLGERYNGIVEVSGSIPLSSTKLFNKLKKIKRVKPTFIFSPKISNEQILLLPSTIFCRIVSQSIVR